MRGIYGGGEGGGGTSMESSHSSSSSSNGSGSNWDSKMPPPLRSRHSGLFPLSPLESSHHTFQPYSNSRHRRAGSSGTTESPPDSYKSAHSSMPSPTSPSPHFTASPSSNTTYDADSPEQQRKSSYGHSTSAMQLVAEAMADLPNLSEVRTACDAYLDECGEYGASLSLCYINRAQLEEIWLQACCMQLSRLQLAFLYTVLACVGSATPAGHPRYGLAYMLTPSTQDKYTSIAMNLLKSYEGDDRNKIWDDAMSQPPASPAINGEGRTTPFPNAVLKCQLLAMIALLQLGRAKYEDAYYFAKQAISTAHSYHLFDTRWWSLYPHISKVQIDTIKIIQMEIVYCFNWTSSVCESQEQEVGNYFDAKLPQLGIPDIHIGDAFEKAILRQKLEFSALARKIALHHHHDQMNGEKQNIQIWLAKALKLDEEIMTIIDSQHPRLRDTPRYALIDPNDRSTIRIATMVILIRGGWMHARWRMMQQFFDQYPFDVFQYTAICSARMTLQMLPLVKESFTSPWQSITSRSWIDGQFNQALFIFLMTIKSHLYKSSPPPRPTSDNHNYSNAIRAELVWFMTNFNRIYNAMNRLRMVRTALSQCAIALRKTPVRIHYSASSSSCSSDLSNDPVLSDTEVPIFELLDDDDDNMDGHTSKSFINGRCDPLQNFIEEYRSQSTFRSAVSTHSPQIHSRPLLSPTLSFPPPSSASRWR